jgi:AcrR family transcriptional regulator
VAGAENHGWRGKAREGGARERLLDAIVKTAGEHGYADFTVERAVKRAGVSSDTFYRFFESREQGLLAAHEAYLNRLNLEVVAACEAGGEWPAKVRRGLGAMIASLVEASAPARVFAIEAAAASFAAAERQFAAMEEFAAMLRLGRRLYPEAASLPEVTERALIGGVASIVFRHLLAESADDLRALQPELVELVLIPYVGEHEARRFARA